MMQVYRHVPRTGGDSETTPSEHYIVYFANELWAEFVSHHDLALHQDYDWQQPRKNQHRHTCVTVEDFPDNLTVSGLALDFISFDWIWFGFAW